MNIRLSIIAEKLVKKGIGIESTQKADPYIRNAVFPCGEEDFEADSSSSVIWVFNESNKHLLEKLRVRFSREGFSFAFCGSGPGECEKAVSMINDIIGEYACWKEQILLKMLEKEDIQTIVDLMGTKVVNPFSLLDDNGFILARSKGHEAIPKGTIWDTMKGNYLNIFDFYSMQEWKKIRSQMDAAGHGHILFVPKKDPQHVYYSIRLYDQNQMIGSIGSMNSSGPFTEGQIAVMEMIRDMLEIYLQTQYNAAESGTIISTAFNRLVNGDYDRSAVRKVLNKRHWKTDDEFLLMAFEFPETAHSEIELASSLNLIHMQFPKSLIALRNSQIIIAVRKADYDPGEKKQREKLEKFLQQYDLYCGISYPFRSFENSRYICEQSSCAVMYASQKMDPSEEVSRALGYKDIQTKHMLSLLSSREDETEKYCHPAILMLTRSSKKTDQVLVPCLRSYLINGRSIARAANALGMHRNTLIYRLERLEEILGVCFAYLPDNEIMGLVLSCYIAEADIK